MPRVDRKDYKRAVKRAERKGWKRANRRDERKNISSGLPGTSAARLP
jgi:hypothetical protein